MHDQTSSSAAIRKGLQVESADGYELDIFDPDASPDLWSMYLDGARREYARFDVLTALPLEELRRPEGIPLAFLLRHDGEAIGGLRVHGPLSDVAAAAALYEMAASPEVAELKRHLERSLVEETLIEVKGTWSAYDHEDRRALALSTTRCVVYAMDLLGANRAFGTAPRHTTAIYKQTGGSIIEQAGVAPFPDDRYETQAIEWTPESFPNLASPEELAAIRKERAAIASALAHDA